MIFFSSWEDIGRVVIIGVLAYLALIFLLRVSGKRTLSKMNAFDLVITVALGSTLATIILSRDVSLAEGVAALVVLVSLQFAVAWLSVRSKKVNRLVKSEPKLLFYMGEFLEDAMHNEWVVRAEILQAVRSQGAGSLGEIQAVVLETDGSFSVIKQSKQEEKNALSDVQGESDRSD